MMTETDFELARALEAAWDKDDDLSKEMHELEEAHDKAEEVVKKAGMRSWRNLARPRTLQKRLATTSLGRAKTRWRLAYSALKQARMAKFAFANMSPLRRAGRISKQMPLGKSGPNQSRRR